MAFAPRCNFSLSPTIDITAMLLAVYPASGNRQISSAGSRRRTRVDDGYGRTLSLGSAVDLAGGVAQVRRPSNYSGLVLALESDVGSFPATEAIHV